MRALRLFAAGLICLLVLGSTALPQAAAAYDPLDPACTVEAANSPTCGSRTTKNPLTGENGLLMKITFVVAAIAGFAAVVVILISGVRYMTAGGDAQKATGARHTLIGALVGLAIISFASLIIMFVISGID